MRWGLVKIRSGGGDDVPAGGAQEETNGAHHQAAGVEFPRAVAAYAAEHQNIPHLRMMHYDTAPTAKATSSASRGPVAVSGRCASETSDRRSAFRPAECACATTEPEERAG